MSDGHGGEILAIRDGIYTTGYAGACSCGYTTEPRERPGEALTDLARHLEHLRPQPKD